MSAQTQKTPEARRPVWQVTPVIIKSGGGGGEGEGDPTQTTVVFNAVGKIFDSPFTDKQWQVAKSSGPAAIMSVEIQDGPKTLKPIECNDGDELVVLEVTFGTDTLVVNELRIHNDLLNTEIAVTSPVLFNVMEAGEERDEWVESKALFATTTPLIVLTQGGRELKKYQCEFIDVTLTLIVDWDGRVG